MRGSPDPFHVNTPSLSSNQFLRLQLSRGTFRPAGLTKHGCRLSACFVLSYLMVAVPLLFTKIEHAAHLGDVPLALQKEAAGRRSLGQVHACCWGVGSRFYLSAPKISINWRCSC